MTPEGYSGSSLDNEPILITVCYFVASFFMDISDEEPVAIFLDQQIELPDSNDIPYDSDGLSL
jgi:hypothetical protein